MARRAALMSLEPYRLTGVQFTDRELGAGGSAIVIELTYMGMKCAGKRIHEHLLKCGGSEYTDVIRQFSKECHISIIRTLSSFSASIFKKSTYQS